tara:strand:- start:769 stop:1143 length:375 start_codon:yes stop_codon:yes gene_type:complete
MIYKDWNDVPEQIWPSSFFSPKEIACRGTGEIAINPDALEKLDKLREMLGGPVRVSSAYRSAYHNAKVGGAPLSQHRLGSAFDIVLGSREKSEIERVARAVGFTGLGLRYKTFIHVDTGRKRSW